MQSIPILIFKTRSANCNYKVQKLKLEKRMTNLKR